MARFVDLSKFGGPKLVNLDHIAGVTRDNKNTHRIIIHLLSGKTLEWEHPDGKDSQLVQDYETAILAAIREADLA